MENSKTIEFFKWLGSFMGFLAVCWIFNKDLPVIHPWMSIWLFISFISARIAVDRLKDDLFINFFWSGALKIFFTLFYQDCETPMMNIYRIIMRINKFS